VTAIHHNKCIISWLHLCSWTQAWAHTCAERMRCRWSGVRSHIAVVVAQLLGWSWCKFEVIVCGWDERYAYKKNGGEKGCRRGRKETQDKARQGTHHNARITRTCVWLKSVVVGMNLIDSKRNMGPPKNARTGCWKSVPLDNSPELSANS
jgi:hypothetical protein